MKYKIVAAICFMLTITLNDVFGQQNKINKKYRLIAHRGGVVDSTTAENSLSALKLAVKKGYWMAEVDLRLTKDSVLITHHDRNFKRYYGVDSLVSEMTWAQISQLKGDKGNKVLLFEDLLKFSQGKLSLMIDNKLRGNDTVLFHKVINLLKKYNLFDDALMIGTDESTEFFTGKIKLSCTRKQLEENMLNPGYKPSNYYLFSGNITKADVAWAHEHNILAVGVINAWGLKTTNPMQVAQQQADQLKMAGLTHFQIDSAFDPFFQ